MECVQNVQPTTTTTATTKSNNITMNEGHGRALKATLLLYTSKVMSSRLDGMSAHIEPL